jgi:hypothetical protein
MRKAAVTVALAIALAGRPAHAACRTGPCPAWLDVLGYTLAAGLAGGYAYGTGYMIYRDVTDADQSMTYGGTEAMVNAAGTALFGGAMVDAIAHDKPGTAAAVAPFALLHTTLMIHGTWRAVHERGEFQPPAHAMTWLGGAAFTTNALLWSSQLDERHGRAFGLSEAAVNGGLAAGLGYLAYDRFASWHGGAGFVYGGMAAVSAGLAVHGMRTAIWPDAPRIDVDGLDLAPTVVSDGRELAAGLGASGTW